jgi:hypothetical protein
MKNAGNDSDVDNDDGNDDDNNNNSKWQQ